MILWLMVACVREDPEAEAILAVKDYTTAELDALVAAGEAVRDNAPTTADGYGRTAAMEGAWRDARTSYERVEGAIAVLFPDLDAATDERYDGFVATAPDDYAFDAEGVTGVHAIERIVWSDRQPSWVVDFEAALPYYSPAAFPASDAEAADLRDLLCARLVDDLTTMRDDFAPLALDSATAFRGVEGSIQEQAEKIDLAQTGADESRYAQHTLADMRANLEGGRATWEAFSPGVLDAGGEDLDAEVRAGFDRLQAAYDAVDGDAIPPVPDGWNPDAPTDAQLSSPYGALWVIVNAEADPDQAGSLAAKLGEAGELLGIPQLQ